jgi:hypothetical protein
MYILRDLGRAIETIIQANDQQLKGGGAFLRNVGDGRVLQVEVC